MEKAIPEVTLNDGNRVPGKETILNDFNYELQLHVKNTLSFEYMVLRDRVLLFVQKMELSKDVSLLGKRLQKFSKFINKPDYYSFSDNYDNVIFKWVSYF